MHSRDSRTRSEAGATLVTSLGDEGVLDNEAETELAVGVGEDEVALVGDAAGLSGVDEALGLLVVVGLALGAGETLALLERLGRSALGGLVGDAAALDNGLAGRANTGTVLVGVRALDGARTTLLERGVGVTSDGEAGLVLAEVVLAVLRKISSA